MISFFIAEGCDSSSNRSFRKDIRRNMEFAGMYLIVILAVLLTSAVVRSIALNASRQLIRVSKDFKKRR
jgi:hypothetical protein